MPGKEFGVFNRNTAALTVKPDSLLISIVVSDVTSTSHPARVQAVQEPGGGELYLGDASWPKPAGKALPQAGDVCLVAVDDTLRPWVIGWLTPNWGH